MIGIEAIGSYIPESRIDNLLLMDKFDVDEEFLKLKTGMLSLSVKSESEETSDMCVSAFNNLQSKTEISMDDIDCILVCTQNPDEQGLPHTSAVVHDKLNLPSTCAAFDVSLGCSGYVYSLSIIQSFMQVNGFKKGLLFTADPYSKIVNKEDKNTSLLFGDAATVTLLGEQPKWVAGKFSFGSQGSERQAITVKEDTHSLEMNGRSVFSFTATVIPNHINTMLEQNNLSLEDIDLFALHQGSRFIVDTLRKRLGVSEDKVPFVASEYGNTVSSSIPLILEDIKDDVNKVVISGFGVGLSWASTVLFRREKRELL